MSYRADSATVQDILGDDYDSANAPSLTAFIRAANLVVTRVATCAVDKGLTLTDAELTEIEAWLAAHFYTRKDRVEQSKGEGGASATFQGQTGMHLEASYYGQTAMDLDFSGCLTAISKRQFAGISWLGKEVSEQIDYDDRD